MTSEERKIYEKQKLDEQKKKKRDKKKLRKKVQRPYRELLSDSQVRYLELTPQVQNNIKKNIEQDEKIPEEYKSQFKKIELDPLKLMLTNIPVNVATLELRHYFNTFMKRLIKDFTDKNPDPVTKVTIGEDGKFWMLDMLDHDQAEKLVNIQTMEYKGYKIKVGYTVSNIDLTSQRFLFRTVQIRCSG